MTPAYEHLHTRLRRLAVASTSLTLLALLFAGLLLLRQRQARADAVAALDACTCCDDLTEHPHGSR